ncbi:MAG: YciI family protein, partial [Chitinophagaceae bacterium]
HSAYWRALMEKGKVVIFGPVLDPKGAYGLGIIAAENEEEVKAFIAGDPAVGINLVYEYNQMLAVVKN